MGLHVKQNQGRTQLQEKLDAELRAKLQKQGQGDIDLDTPDGVDDSAYIEGTKKTTSLALVWLILFVAAAVLFVLFVKAVAGV